jgi:RNA polymerase sigma-70 factor (ECF subfamily)
VLRLSDELIEKAKKGNSKSFMCIVEGLKAQMYKTAYIQLNNEQDALDAVQETLVKAFLNIKNLKENRFFKSWIIRILLNECHNIQRYRNKIIPMERENMELKNHYNQNNFETVEINSILGKMEYIYREIIDLRYNHDLKIDEISRVLDIPAGTVKSRLNRAHAILKKQFIREEASS